MPLTQNALRVNSRKYRRRIVYLPARLDAGGDACRPYVRNDPPLAWITWPVT